MLIAPDKVQGQPQHHRIQHFAFAYHTLDELLGTYARLKALAVAAIAVPAYRRFMPPQS